MLTKLQRCSTGFLCRSPENNFKRSAHELYPSYVLGHYTLKLLPLYICMAYFFIRSRKIKAFYFYAYVLLTEIFLDEVPTMIPIPTLTSSIHTGLALSVIIHYIYVIMTTVASQITSLAVVYSIVYSDADERSHQSSASLAFVRGIHRDRWIPRTKGQ